MWEYSIVTSVLIGIITVLLLYWVTSRRKLLNHLQSHGIPCPPPSLLGGNYHPSMSKKNPLTLLEKHDEWIKKYGPVCGYYVGTIPKILVADLELLKSILIKDFPNFSNRPRSFVFGKPYTDMLVNQESEDWKNMRKIINPVFSSSKLKQMSGLMHECIDVHMELLEKLSHKKEDFDIYAMFQGLTLDVIGRCALAMNINCQRNPNDWLLQSVREFFSSAANAVVLLAITLPGLINILRYARKFTKAAKIDAMIVENCKKVIKMRRENPEVHKRTDVLQLMLDAVDTSDEPENQALNDVHHKAAEDKEKKYKLSDDEVVANAHMFILAGYETTSLALGFTSYLLTKHPEEQEKVYQEIKKKLGDKTDISYEDVNDLVYLDQVWCESLRMYPPIISFVQRVTKNGLDLGEGRFIPPKAAISIPVYHIHHDPNIWPEPNKFDPSRFSPENKASHHALAFLPFGAGPRNCIGLRFAQLEGKLTLARILSKYRLVPGPKFEDELDLVHRTIAINPKNGIWLKVEER